MDQRRIHFEQTLWPHLRGAYNLARWLVGNPQDAEDVVQESFAKAYQASERFRGADPRPWLLAIVRNTAMNFRRQGKPRRELERNEPIPDPPDHSPGPEAVLLQEDRRNWVRSAIARLPEEFREAIVLREIEGLSYKEIAWVAKVPIGTVMSRLSRARQLLLKELEIGKGEAL